jgi:hypothetical protein
MKLIAKQRARPLLMLVALAPLLAGFGIFGPDPRIVNKFLATRICNCGEQDISYAVADMESRRVQGWFQLKAGQCETIQYVHSETDMYDPWLGEQYLAFAGTDSQVQGGAVLTDMKVEANNDRWGGTTFVPAEATFFVRHDQGFDYDIDQRECPEGAAPFPFTFKNVRYTTYYQQGYCTLNVHPQAHSKTEAGPGKAKQEEKREEKVEEDAEGDTAPLLQLLSIIASPPCFDEFKWDADLEEFKGLIEQKSRSYAVTSTWAKDCMNCISCEWKDDRKVVFYFTRAGDFFMVTVSSSGQEDGIKAREDYTIIYGPPAASDEGTQSYTWGLVDPCLVVEFPANTKITYIRPGSSAHLVDMDACMRRAGK